MPKTHHPPIHRGILTIHKTIRTTLTSHASRVTLHDSKSSGYQDDNGYYQNKHPGNFDVGEYGLTYIILFGLHTRHNVTQIGACFLASHTGCSLKHFENDVAYIAGWLKKLKDDRRFILFASSKAQRAVDYILNQPIADVKEEIGPTADVSA